MRKGFIFNPSNCECKCDKSCNIDEYLDYRNCKCKKKLVDKLIEECTKNIDETNLVKKNLDGNKDRCSFCTVYKVLFCIFFIISIGIGIYFVYHKYVNCNKYDLRY